jgi:hypothetical protein
MEINLIYDIIGYVASFFVACSLMMRNIARLRILSLTGGATFLLYGILINSMPVALLNAFIVSINLYHLYLIYTSKATFDVLQVDPDDTYLKHFLQVLSFDIKRFQPEFAGIPEKNPICIFVISDTLPAGLIIGSKSSDGTLTVHLDYVMRRFRDYKMGVYVYEQQKSFFSNLGIHRFHAFAETPAHISYLKKVGFKEVEPYHFSYTLE